MEVVVSIYYRDYVPSQELAWNWHFGCFHFIENMDEMITTIKCLLLSCQLDASSVWRQKGHCHYPNNIWLRTEMTIAPYKLHSHFRFVHSLYCYTRYYSYESFEVKLLSYKNNGRGVSHYHCWTSSSYPCYFLCH